MVSVLSVLMYILMNKRVHRVFMEPVLIILMDTRVVLSLDILVLIVK